MAARKGGLAKGRGLDSLIEPKVKTETKKSESKSGDMLVDINKVEPDKNQPRKNFNEDKLNELCDSIKDHGVIEPLIVQDKKTYYKIVAGERRWRAAKMAGLKKIPVIICDLTDKEAAEISLIENIQREDLNPIEEAQGYKRLQDEYDYTHDEIAEKVSKNRTTITNAMRLLKLDERVQQMLIDEKLTSGHARCLLTVTNPDEQYQLAERIFDEKLNVRNVEKLIKNLDKEKAKKKKEPTDEQLELAFRALEERLKTALGTKVSINSKDKTKGSIEIEFYSQEELDDMVDSLCTIKRS